MSESGLGRSVERIAGWALATLGLSMVGCGGNNADGGGSKVTAFDSGLDANRTIGSLSQAERVKLCEDSQEYAYSQFSVESWCLYLAKGAARSWIETSPDQTTFQAKCREEYDRCLPRGEAGLADSVSQAKQSCSTTPETATRGCEVSVSLYDRCWTRRANLIADQVIVDCESSSASDLDASGDSAFESECVEPIEAPCS